MSFPIHRIWLQIFALLAASFIATCDQPHVVADELRTDSAVGHAKSLSTAFRRAAEAVSPAVVTVLVRTDEPEYAVAKNGEMVPYFNSEEEDSVGSGVIIHAKGFVLTNSHVVAKATQIIVRLADKREFNIKRVKLDKPSDVALLIMDSPPADLVVARLGNSNEVQIGDWVIAIGSPYEYASTVSAGIISGRNRSLKQIKRGKLLQTDAAINPGNSGGPLVNLEGEIIGINTAIASTSGGYEGIGFAIPSNNAKWILSQLARYGRVERAYLGVDIRDLRAGDARERGVPLVEGGVLVNRVNPRSPAFLAGLRPGDVIVKFGNTKVHDSRDLQGVVEQQEIGSSHPVTFIRDGNQATVDVRVERLRPAGASESSAEQYIH